MPELARKILNYFRPPPRPPEPCVINQRIIQMIPATGWRVFIDSTFEDVAAFGLTHDGRVVPLVVATAGEERDSIVELKGKFALAGPVYYEARVRAANLRNVQYGSLR